MRSSSGGDGGRWRRGGRGRPVSARPFSARRGPGSRGRRSEASFRALLDGMPDGVLVFDARGVVYTNTAMQAIAGRSADELAGMAMLELVHPQDRPIVEERLRAFEAGEGRRRIEVRLIRPDGEARPVEAEGVTATFGKRAARVVLVRDLSERRRSEETFRQMQMRLMVADRMASMGTLAAGVAHEINNPLSYLLANLSFLADELEKLRGVVDPAGVAELTQVIGEARDGGDRIRQIVRDLRTFSRTDDERREPVDVRRVIDSALNMARNELRHRARVRRDYGEAPSVEANPSRLGQVFLNLLINAAQAIPEGHADENEIVVVTRHEAGQVLVEVRDTGQGMAPEQLQHAFEPYTTIGGTTKGIGEGTGLGLSICHGIVTALGGDITVRSQPGVGSTFTVRLPMAAQPQAVNSAAATGIAARRGRVLVIDDEVGVGQVVRRSLKAEHDVTPVARAREALALIDSAQAAGEPFDLILCDLMMPEMTGAELYELLEARHPEVVPRMVFLTGGAFTPTAQAFLARVPNARLEKPFEVAALRALARSRVA